MLDNDEKEHRECKWSWTDSDYFWEASCGFTFQFMGGRPKENDMNYCPGCGNKLIVKNTAALSVFWGM